VKAAPVVVTVMATASAMATAGGNTKTEVTATETVIAATRAMTKTTTRIGERRGGRESDLRINGGANCHTSVHIKKMHKSASQLGHKMSKKCQTCVRTGRHWIGKKRVGNTEGAQKNNFGAIPYFLEITIVGKPISFLREFVSFPK
jgi:hypothetical protein